MKIDADPQGNPVPAVQDSDDDESLDDAAQGYGTTSDEAAAESGEIDAIGHAAGLVVPDDKPFRGIEEVERRDQHRWELDPDSADNNVKEGDRDDTSIDP